MFKADASPESSIGNWTDRTRSSLRTIIDASIKSSSRSSSPMSPISTTSSRYSSPATSHSSNPSINIAPPTPLKAAHTARKPLPIPPNRNTYLKIVESDVADALQPPSSSTYHLSRPFTPDFLPPPVFPTKSTCRAPSPLGCSSPRLVGNLPQRRSNSPRTPDLIAPLPPGIEIAVPPVATVGSSLPHMSTKTPSPHTPEEIFFHPSDDDLTEYIPSSCAMDLSVLFNTAQGTYTSTQVFTLPVHAQHGSLHFGPSTVAPLYTLTSKAFIRANPATGKAKKLFRLHIPSDGLVTRIGDCRLLFHSGTYVLEHPALPSAKGEEALVLELREGCVRLVNTTNRETLVDMDCAQATLKIDTRATGKVNSLGTIDVAVAAVVAVIVIEGRKLKKRAMRDARKHEAQGERPRPRLISGDSLDNEWVAKGERVRQIRRKNYVFIVIKGAGFIVHLTARLGWEIVKAIVDAFRSIKQ